jgi:hypothetical protein
MAGTGAIPSPLRKLAGPSLIRWGIGTARTLNEVQEGGHGYGQNGGRAAERSLDPRRLGPVVIVGVQPYDVATDLAPNMATGEVPGDGRKNGEVCPSEGPVDGHGTSRGEATESRLKASGYLFAADPAGDLSGRDGIVRIQVEYTLEVELVSGKSSLGRTVQVRMFEVIVAQLPTCDEVTTGEVAASFSDMARNVEKEVNRSVANQTGELSVLMDQIDPDRVIVRGCSF